MYYALFQLKSTSVASASRPVTSRALREREEREIARVILGMCERSDKINLIQNYY